jgi:hypothetical protein
LWTEENNKEYVVRRVKHNNISYLPVPETTVLARLIVPEFSFTLIIIVTETKTNKIYIYVYYGGLLLYMNK